MKSREVIDLLTENVLPEFSLSAVQKSRRNRKVGVEVRYRDGNDHKSGVISEIGENGVKIGRKFVKNEDILP